MNYRTDDYFFAVVVVVFRQATYSVPESNDVIFHIVKRNRTTEDVRVLFNTSYGSAGIFLQCNKRSWLCSRLKSLSTGRSDFESLSKVVTIQANETETTVEVDVIDDSVHENTESFDVVLSTDMALVEIGPNSRAVAMIIDDDRKLVT